LPYMEEFVRGLQSNRNKLVPDKAKAAADRHTYSDNSDH
jgi:hypothetical protein